MPGYFTTTKVVEDLHESYRLVYGTNTPIKGISSIRSDHTCNSFRSGGKWDEQTETEQLTQLASGLSWQDFMSEFDVGHPFWVNHYKQTISHRRFTSFVGTKGLSNNRYVSGPLLLSPTTGPAYVYPTLPAFNSSKVGNQLMSDARPAAPDASLAVAFIEFFRDGLPDLPGASFFESLKKSTVVLNQQHVKSADDILVIKKKSNLSASERTGNEFLNYVYGFEAMARDLATLLVSVVNISDVIMQYKRDSGQIVRRKRGIPRDIVSTYTTNIGKAGVNMNSSGSDISGGAWSDLYVGGASGQIGTVDLAYQGVTDVWWEGEFVYYLHEGNTPYDRFLRYSELAHKLLGVGLTPQTLYDAAPWSWLVDWVYDIGGLLGASGADDASETVARYSYLMRTFRGINTYTTQGIKFVNNSPGVVSRSYQFTRKERYRGTPFGFGLNPSVDFNERQWAILGFLGVTLGPRFLRRWE